MTNTFPGSFATEVSAGTRDTWRVEAVMQSRSKVTAFVLPPGASDSCSTWFTHGLRGPTLLVEQPARSTRQTAAAAAGLTAPRPFAHGTEPRKFRPSRRT